MQPTSPMPLTAPPGVVLGSWTAPARSSFNQGHPMPVSFTGSGSEYFRIWIVNLLLTLVTLGVYYPWAKVRRLRYFYGNTLVGGYGLDFHGNPKRMLRGYLLVGLLMWMYSIAQNVSDLSGLIAFGILAALWPALFRASQQFRLANTSWRGLRFRFTGDTAGAYRALLPLFVPGIAAFAALVANGQPPAGAAPSPVSPAMAMLVPAVMLALVPLCWWMVRKYQHDGYAYAQVQAQLRTGPVSFYWICLKGLGLVVVAAVLAAFVAGVLAGVSVHGLFASEGTTGRAAVVGIMAAIAAVYLAVALVVWPYFVSRMQNLVWTRTKSSQVRFDSRLAFWPLVGLTLKNWLLIVLTLGLYWPFAAVAMARMRLQAVTVFTRTDPDEFHARQRRRAEDATGDAAGDLVGVDIGM